MRNAMARLRLDEEEEEDLESEDYYDEEEEEHCNGTDLDDDTGPALPDVPEDVCAICLEQIEMADLAIVKGCEHQYCAQCILRWASCCEVPACPQCKKPFNYLYTHRLLDGTLSDAPLEESVVLLLRAKWFVDHVQVQERGKPLSAAMAEWDSNGELDDYDDLDADEDDRIEAFYFSSAAGQARVVIGNRRGGENGFMRAGRMYARPALQPATPNNGTKQMAKAAQRKASAGGSSGSSAAGIQGSARAGSSGAATREGCASSRTSAAQSETRAKNAPGRRAQRNARRAAADSGSAA